MNWQIPIQRSSFFLNI